MTTTTEWQKSIQRSLDSEVEDRRKRAIRISKAMNAREHELREIAEDEKRRGYCPHCFTLLPVNGECWCGYIKEDK